MKILVIAEHDNQILKPATLSVITAAQALDATVDVLVAGFQCQAVADTLAFVKGIAKVQLADHEVYQVPLAERIADLVIQLSDEYTIIMAPATTMGKNCLPRVAAILDVAQVSDITAVIDDHTYERPIYAGNAVAKVKSLDDKQVVTVRVTAFPPAEVLETAQEITISKIDYVSQNEQTQFVDMVSQQSERPDLAGADIIVSGGRGLKNKEMFERLIAIADRLGAAIGASRAAVDAGLAPNDYQVGQTGKIVAPKLYFAVGISGAIQHIAGMKDSRIIVAINKDPDAPIFKIADYGLVADLNDVLPEWEDLLIEMGYS